MTPLVRLTVAGAEWGIAVRTLLVAFAALGVSVLAVDLCPVVPLRQDRESASSIPGHPSQAKRSSFERRARVQVFARPVELHGHSAPSSCGDYLVVGHVRETNAEEDAEVPWLPCHGPLCSGAPPAQTPPGGPSSFAGELPEAIFLLTTADGLPSRWVPAECHLAQSLIVGSTIFRPPKS